MFLRHEFIFNSRLLFRYHTCVTSHVRRIGLRAVRVVWSSTPGRAEPEVLAMKRPRRGFIAAKAATRRRPLPPSPYSVKRINARKKFRGTWRHDVWTKNPVKKKSIKRPTAFAIRLKLFRNFSIKCSQSILLKKNSAYHWCLFYSLINNRYHIFRTHQQIFY